MPAQPLLRSPPLVDEIVAVIDQQLELPVDALVWPRPAQVRLSQRRPGDRERVDRVRLAARPAGAPLRRPSASAAPAPAPHPRRAAAAPASASAAGSPRPPTAAPRRAPPPSRAARRCRPGSSSRRASGRPRRPRRRSPTACVRPLRSRSSDRLLSRWGRPASGQTSLEAKATLLSGHARRSRSAAATQRWTSALGRHSELSQPPPPESAPLTGRHHDVENMRDWLETVGQVCRKRRKCANGAATGAATGFALGHVRNAEGIYACAVPATRIGRRRVTTRPRE